MDVIHDLQRILIDALLREMTVSQAEAALMTLERVVASGSLVMSDADDERAAAWAAVMVQRLSAAESPSCSGSSGSCPLCYRYQH